MNVVIFSGGTGSYQLQKGLKEFNRDIHITNIINGYDNGKSTGVVRKAFQNLILGPSDIRKVQYEYYKCNNDVYDSAILDFFESRCDLPGNPEDLYGFLLNKIRSWTFLKGDFVDAFMHLAHIFVDNYFKHCDPKKDGFNFNLANIFYGAWMYRTSTYNTIKQFEDIFNLKDSVLVKSTYPNGQLIGITRHKKRLQEFEICDHFDGQDPIIEIEIEHQSTIFADIENSERIKEELKIADIIIYSSGTFWSSIAPTFYNNDLNMYVQENTKAKKYVVLNLNNDGDSRGYTLENFISLYKFHILVPEDTTFIYPTHREAELKNTGKFLRYESKENEVLHHGKNLASIILKNYYQCIFDIKDNIVFDFDGTLYHNNDVKTSVDNLKTLKRISEFYKCTIITGNSQTNLDKKISRFDLQDSVKIITDAGSVLRYYNETVLDNVYEFSCLDYSVVNKIKKLINNVSNKLGIHNFDFEIRGTQIITTMVTISGLSEQDRTLLFSNIYNQLDKLNLKVRIAGSSSLDITHKSTNKYSSLKSLLNIEEFIYFGNESKVLGNDYEISQGASVSYQINSALDMNIILKLHLHDISDSIRGVILAAGNQERFKYDIPKCLFEIGGLPLLIRNIQTMQHFVNHIVVVLGNNNREVSENILKLHRIPSSVDIIYVQPGGGTWNSLSKLPKNEDTILIWGDSLQMNDDLYFSCIHAKYDESVLNKTKGRVAFMPLVFVDEPYTFYDLDSYGRIFAVYFNRFGQSTDSGYQDLSIFFLNRQLLKDLRIEPRKNGELELLEMCNNPNDYYIYTKTFDADTKIRSFNTPEEFKEIFEEVMMYE